MCQKSTPEGSLQRTRSGPRARIGASERAAGGPERRIVTRRTAACASVRLEAGNALRAARKRQTALLLDRTRPVHKHADDARLRTFARLSDDEARSVPSHVVVGPRAEPAARRRGRVIVFAVGRASAHRHSPRRRPRSGRRSSFRQRGCTPGMLADARTFLPPSGNASTHTTTASSPPSASDTYAIHRSSGDSAGCVSLAGDCANGLASPPRAIVRMSRLPSRIANRTSVPLEVIGRGRSSRGT
jgi:hypothetical protein